MRCCWIGMHVGQRLQLAESDLRELYYTLLLKDLGCSSNASRICELYLTDDLSFKRDFKWVDGTCPKCCVLCCATPARPQVWWTVSRRWEAF